MSEGSSRTCPHPDSSLTSGICPAQSLCLGQSPHLLQGVAHVASSVTPCLPLQLPNLPDPSAHLSANLIFLIIPCAHLSGHLAVSQGWEHPENRGFVCFGHCCIVGARTGLRCAGVQCLPASTPTQPILGHREASTNGSLIIRLGLRQGCGWRGRCGGPCFLRSWQGLPPSRPCPGQAEPPLRQAQECAQTDAQLPSLAASGWGLLHPHPVRGMMPGWDCEK